MATGAWLLAFVTVQRLVELALARRNTRRLLARGAREVGAGHYPVMVGFHATWLASLWWLGWQAPLEPAWTIAFLALQPFRLWVVASLGERWTTRVVAVDAPPIRTGPYRILDHPNYAIVVGEIALLPLALGAPGAALAFSLAHLPLLRHRLAVETAALAEMATRADDRGSR